MASGWEVAARLRERLTDHGALLMTWDIAPELRNPKQQHKKTQLERKREQTEQNVARLAQRLREPLEAI